MERPKIQSRTTKNNVPVFDVTLVEGCVLAWRSERLPVCVTKDKVTVSANATGRIVVENAFSSCTVNFGLGDAWTDKVEHNHF